MQNCAQSIFDGCAYYIVTSDLTFNSTLTFLSFRPRYDVGQRDGNKGFCIQHVESFSVQFLSVRWRHGFTNIPNPRQRLLVVRLFRVKSSVRVSIVKKIRTYVFHVCIILIYSASYLDPHPYSNASQVLMERTRTGNVLSLVAEFTLPVVYAKLDRMSVSKGNAQTDFFASHFPYV